MSAPSPPRLSHESHSHTPSDYGSPVTPLIANIPQAPVTPLVADVPPGPVTPVIADLSPVEEAPPINPTSPSPSKPRLRVPIPALLSQDRTVDKRFDEDGSYDGSEMDIDSAPEPSFPRPITPVPNSPPLGDIRVLLFGDEYTWGYSPDDPDKQHYPWGIKETFEKYNVRASLQISSSAKERAFWRDWVVIWGGSHDLRAGANAAHIYKGLEEAYTVAYTAGSNVLLLTVLESRDFTEDMEAERDELNELIFGTKMRACGMHTIHGLKIDGRLPNHPHSIAQRAGSSAAYADEYEARWAEEGIYPSPEGYEVIGKLVAQEIWRCRAVHPVHRERRVRMESV